MSATVSGNIAICWLAAALVDPVEPGGVVGGPPQAASRDREQAKQGRQKLVGEFLTQLHW